VERASDKHGPLLDEQLEHETRSMVQGAPVEARSQESREQEGPAEGDPTPDSRLAGGRAQQSEHWPTDDELEARAELARHIEPSVFPADRAALVASARRQHAPGWVLDNLDALPDGRRYETTEAVWEALGGSREARRA
jgi:post-segregation antitoxin (ccd killing protein)